MDHCNGTFAVRFPLLQHLVDQGVFEILVRSASFAPMVTTPTMFQAVVAQIGTADGGVHILAEGLTQSAQKALARTTSQVPCGKD